MGHVEIGMRVLRGPDWRWADQDGGEGNTGTIVEVGKPGSTKTPYKTVVVQWDAGSRTNYRTGYQSSFDLRLVDNAPIGIRHQNHICDSCKKQGIAGIRWKCARCFDYDLCTTCYMADKHESTHPFIRYETGNSTGVEICSRKNCLKVPLQGIYVGARVVRGPDWDWGNQDGGEGKCGRVTEIRGWDNESGRSVANVTWACNTTNVYRVGHKGKVDIKCIQPASQGYIYIEHLPTLGKVEDTINRGAEALSASPCQLPFLVGERVRVSVPSEKLKEMQEGHGGWNQRMVEIIDKVGYVHRITDKGDVRVQYECLPSRWTIHPGALSRATTFVQGDSVLLITDAKKCEKLQKGHGEWIEAMKDALGKSGIITRVYPDGDLRVEIEGKTWTLNPHCVNLLPYNPEHNTDKAREVPVESPLIPPIDPAKAHLSTQVDRLVRDAAQGYIEKVTEVLKVNPEIVDAKSSGKTCLQVACHQGHMDLVRQLMKLKATIDFPDDDGDTPIHYAAFGNQPEIMEMLICKGVNINSVNKANCSVLHVAVNKQHPACVKLLLKYNCDLNIQDTFGDTPLHDAAGKNNVEILEMLGNSPKLNVFIRNKRGFNVLHHAALKGNNYAIEKILYRARQLVDEPKDDGFVALHLASLNGHNQSVESLLTLGKANVNFRNHRKQTSLLLAVSQGHIGVAEVLIKHKADVNLFDEDGETPLHFALNKDTAWGMSNSSFSALFHQIMKDISENGLDGNYGVAMACFLVKNGASLSHYNNKGKRPLDLIDDPIVIDVVRSYSLEQNDIHMDMDLRALDLAADGLLHTDSAINALSKTTICDNQSNSQPASPANRKLLDATETNESDFDVSSRENTSVCIICTESKSSVIFQPCGHSVTCEECASRVKKCLTCKEVVISKLATDGRVLSSRDRQPSANRLKYLETKIMEIEEAHCCSICMERRRNVAFLCGHGACVVCATPLKTCHMCRKTITRKINLY